jgi:hypothetical protein
MTAILILFTIALHALGAWLLIKHRRNVRHHRSSAPVIGSDPQLTQKLHERLCDNQPQTDWLNPYIIRAKCHAAAVRMTHTEQIACVEKAILHPSTGITQRLAWLNRNHTES